MALVLASIGYLIVFLHGLILFIHVFLSKNLTSVQNPLDFDTKLGNFNFKLLLIEAGFTFSVLLWLCFK